MTTVDINRFFSTTNGGALVGKSPISKEEILSFSEIWEKEVRWEMGPKLLLKMVEFCENKSLLPSRHDEHTLGLTIPVPLIYDEISKEDVPITTLVPRELIPLLNERINLAVSGRMVYVEELLHKWRVLPFNDTTLLRIQEDLEHIERNIISSGGDSLSVTLAKVFGVYLLNFTIATIQIRNEET